ncbi:hypothetical protein FOS14_02155 [Skermania sp. ID1734]|nr:hypothetical protein FOS14_02155 [Skermania sp. ID1734]
MPHQGADERQMADPDRVRADIAELLAELSLAQPAGTDLTARARLLEQAHDVLVDALATVDKI